MSCLPDTIERSASARHALETDVAVTSREAARRAVPTRPGPLWTVADAGALGLFLFLLKGISNDRAFGFET